MIISSYNQAGIGDTLIVMLANSTFAEQSFESKGLVTRIFNTETKKTVGYNFFEISKSMKLDGAGQIILTTEEVAELNKLIQAAGFADLLEADPSPKFVVGFVKECVAHPDSDHLSITQTEIDNGEVVQIVCGAPNIAANQKVVVAKVGAMMPNGLLIWDGELRGEPSHGMICSAKELNLPDASAKKGILVLAEDAVTGEAFPIGK